MTNINKIEIRQFRGIKQLMISDFSEINLIVVTTAEKQHFWKRFNCYLRKQRLVPLKVS